MQPVVVPGICLIRLALLMLVLLSPYAHSSSLRFQHITLADGLSDLTVNAIAQDSAGYLWFATRNGLSRYDGIRFKVFKNIPDDSTSLIHNNVQEVFVDSRGLLWVGTSRGLCLFDRLAQTFRTIPLHSPQEEQMVSGDVNSIIEDRSGFIWMGVAGMGVVKLDAGGVVLQRFVHSAGDPHSLSSNNIRPIAFDRNGDLWAGSLDGGANRINVATGHVERFLHDPGNPASIGKGRIYTLAVDNEGTVWIGTEYDGLNRYDEHSSTFTRFAHDPRKPSSISENWVSSIFFDRQGRGWIGTQGGGIHLFNRSAGTFEQFITDSYDPLSISDTYIQKVFEDRSGIIWVGTGSGLNKVLRSSPVFNHVRNSPGQARILASHSVHAVIKDKDGVLWVGTRSGLDRIMSFGLQLKSSTVPLLPGQENLAVTSLLEDRKGNLWIGSHGNGVFRLSHADRRAGRFRFTRFRHDPEDRSSISADNIYSLYEDSSGFLWVGTEGGGLNRINPATGVCERYTASDGEGKSLIGNTIMSITQDSRGMMLIATFSGVSILDPPTGKVLNLEYSERSRNSLPSRATYGIVEDSDGKMWIATARGLGIYDPTTERLTTFLSDHGLPDVFLKSIVADKHGRIWISSRNGLTLAGRDSSGSVTFRNYDVSDGLPVLDFNPLSGSTSSDGELFFGSGNGFIRFYPDDLKSNTRPPPVAITSVKIFEKERPIQSGFELTHKEYHVTFEFAALDFVTPEKNQYEYRLEGLNDTWIKAGKIKSAVYANLSPGKYVFQVRAANSDGHWNKEGASLEFMVLPPYWETWWFRVLVVLLLIGVLTFLYRYRVRKILEVERLRTRIASDLHDDVGSALTKIAVHSEIIQNTSNAEKITSSSQVIGSMSREIITTLSDIVWSIDARHDTMDDLANRVKTFALDVLSPREVRVHFNTEGFESAQKVSSDVRQNIYLICKEAVNNIAKHSQASEVWISLSREGNSISLTIHDNGRGLPEEPSAGGHGLKNMKMRAERIGGILTYSSNEGLKISLHSRVE